MNITPKQIHDFTMLMRKYGVSQRALAKHAGIPAYRVGSWIRLESCPSRDDFITLLGALTDITQEKNHEPPIKTYSKH